MQEGFVRADGNGSVQTIAGVAVASTPLQPPAQTPTQVPAPAPAPMIDQQQTPAEAQQLLETWPVKVKLLHRQIRGNKGEMLSELAFREPTGGDIARIGNPCRVTFAGEVEIDEKKMMLIMANLSGVLSPLLEVMDPRDWNSCAYRLRSFFLPDPQAWV